MADNTKIEWADATLNYVNGCDIVSPGCANCYAMRAGGRNLPGHPSTGLTKPSKAGHVWTGEVRRNETALLQALRWKRPRRIFWIAHGDLFHPAVPDEWIDQQFAVMALTPQHIHMVLTKRPDRMREYCSILPNRDDIVAEQSLLVGAFPSDADKVMKLVRMPLPNVWLGTSVEDQQRADERIPHLLNTPAAVRFISAEPLLGPVDLTKIGSADISDPHDPFDAIGRDWHDLDNKIDWVIVGGESGPGSRPMHPDWARSLRDQCDAAGVAFHFKQWGDWLPLGASTGEGPSGGEWPTNGRSICRIGEAGIRCADGYPMQRVGKRRAGRLLDGVTHDGVPA